MSDAMHCPLCAGVSMAPFHQDRRRPYLRCDACSWYLYRPPVISAGMRKRPSTTCTGTRWETRGTAHFIAAGHADAGAPGAGARGLDFGCGPAPPWPISAAGGP